MTIFKRKSSGTEARSELAEAPVFASDVFTPSVPAGISFVGRQREMKDLVQYGLKVPGTQVLIWGESGAGKSTLINKALASLSRRAVITSCTPGLSYEQVLESAFAGTGAFYIAETLEGGENRNATTATVGGDFIGVSVKHATDESSSTATKKVPLSRPQLTPQNLLKELGQRSLSWVIEDFHKVDRAVREEIAHALKVFADHGQAYPQTSVVLLGVSESVDELVAGKANLASRLVDVEVAPLSNEDLSKILEVGQGLLNVDFTVVKDRLLHTSVNTASITHSLALACCNQREIESARSDTVQFSIEDFEEAVRGYVRTRSSTLKTRFQDALRVGRKRKFDNPKILLVAMAQSPETGATVGELLELVRKEHPEYPSGNASNYLRELQEPGRGSVIRRTAQGKYRFDEPLLHAYARAYFQLSAAGQLQPVSNETEGVREWENALSASLSQFAKVLQYVAAEPDNK